MSDYTDAQKDPVAARLVQAFCRQIAILLNEDFRGVCMGKVKAAHELLTPTWAYLGGKRGRPTTEEVQTVIIKLNEGVNIMKQRYPDGVLLEKLLLCGPLLKAYLDYINPRHIETLKWKNDWILTETNMCPEKSMLCDMRHLLNGWNIESLHQND